MPFCSLGATQENTEHCWIQQKQENMLLATNFVLAHCILPKIEQKISVHTNFFYLLINLRKWTNWKQGV